MGYTVPTLDQMTSLLVATWKAFFPLSNVASRFAYHWKRLRAYSMAITDLHAHIDSAQDSVMPDTATGAFLSRWGNAVGVKKKGATGANGTNALRVVGTAGTVLPINSVLTDQVTGLQFETSIGFTVPGAGFGLVNIQGIDTGAETNLSAGATLQFNAPPVGIQSIATIVTTLQGGYEVEADPAYSVRVNDQLGKPRMGGSQDDFQAWAEQVTGVANGYCYPNRAGVGTVDVVALQTGVGIGRILPAAVQTAVLNRITGADGFANTLGAAPCQVAATGGSLRLLALQADTQNVEITVQDNGDPAFARDWNDTGGPLVVLAYTAGTLQVQFTTNVPGSMEPGQRIVFRGVASAQDGSVSAIQQIVAADTISLVETPVVNLAATDQAYSGGPLIEPIRDAIFAHMNGQIVYADNGVPTPADTAASVVGLNVLSEGIGPANPGGIYGPWLGSLIVAVLQKIASYATGVRNVAVITPAADYDSPDTQFPNDGTQNMICPGSVLIRYAA